MTYASGSSPELGGAWYSLTKNGRSCHQMVSRPRNMPEGFEVYIRQDGDEVVLPDGSKRITLRAANKVGKVDDAFFTDMKACEQELKARAVARGERSAPLYIGNGEAYVDALRKRYASRIRYVDQNALITVENFHIDCRTGDGRYLPLSNILLEKASLETPKAWVMIEVVSTHEGGVQVREQVVGPNGPINKPSVSMEIDRSGILQLYGGVRSEAILNQCFSKLAIQPKAPGR